MGKRGLIQVVTPGRWRKRRLVIEAVRYDGTPEAFRVIAEWSSNSVRHDPHSAMPIVWSPEGPKYLNSGDWVIRGVLGEYYPCRAEVFEATYEPADAPPDYSSPVLTTQQVRAIQSHAGSANPAELRNLLESLAFSHETLRHQETE